MYCLAARTIDSGLFDACQKEIFSMLHKDSWSRYKKSSVFNIMVLHLHASLSIYIYLNTPVPAQKEPLILSFHACDVCDIRFILSGIIRPPV